ncbi:hypothetical protein Tco_0874361 [Tanacetum coccineum]|uniref:Uncharacterized protein n=1 Tax=Tanacetum coccineum TaxID=301880 RepID=A0ABQ5BLD1_9ASTR
MTGLATHISLHEFLYFFTGCRATIRIQATPLLLNCLTGGIFINFRLCYVLKGLPLTIMVLGISCHVRLGPRRRLCGELDLPITKLRVSVLEKGASPIVISKETSLMGQECSPKNPTSGTFESTLDTLMGDFSFKKQCSQVTSHELPLSMYTRLTCLSKILAVIVTGAEELWFLVTGGNVISLHSEVGPSKVLLLTQGSPRLIMRMGASTGGKVAMILQLLQSGFLADDNHWCRAHDLRVNSSTWSCLEIVYFQTFEEVARKFLLPFLWLEFLLDFWTG